MNLPELQAQVRQIEIRTRRLDSDLMIGQYQSVFKGQGMDFDDIREYQPGDEVRHIDWNVYARLGKLLLRLFEEEEDLTVYLLVDASASMGLGDGARFDQARRIAAALAYVSLANLDRVSLIGLSDRVSERLLPARGKAQIFHVLRFLSSLKPGGETRLGDAVQSFVHQAPRRGLAILVSDLEGTLPELQEWLRDRAAHDVDGGCQQLAVACHTIFGNAVKAEVSLTEAF